ALDPKLPHLKSVEAELALRQKRFAEAEGLLRAALQEDPGSSDLACGIAMCVLSNRQWSGLRAPAVQPLAERFPDDGPLACLYGVALAQDDNARAAVQQLGRARRLGTDPAAVI